jgi:hypothetical protein
MDALQTPLGGMTEEGIFDVSPPIDGVQGFNWEQGDDIPF